MCKKIVFPRKPPADFTYNPPRSPLEIIYHDDDFLVLSKPAELLSVPGRKAEHADSLEKRAQAEFPEARIVHRLDMSTSGLIIMAMNAPTHRNLGLQFERRKTKKIYIARVWGQLEKDQGHVDLPLICDWPNRPLQMVDHENGRSSQTDWEVLSREKGATRVALYPITGRTHQLRVHMAEIGHPILGDDFYAHEQALNAESRLQLHAYKLMVYHPKNGEEMWFESPCPF
ncbi:MAG: RNA pseudouridine synthase [Zetaproteobacteria bacterium]|nr:MAG: RNA pseudouridine synthase [Zetaproteobacteria bacterium]